MTNTDLENQIIKFYSLCGSLKRTANEFGIGIQKTRKILITHNAYRCLRSELIAQMKNEGKSTKEIAKILNVKPDTINSYLPYTKCRYNNECPTANALRIRKYREKNTSK